MRTVGLFLAVFLMVALFDFLRLAFLRWRWNKRMASLVRDMNWRHWIGAVKTRLESITSSENVDRVIGEDAEWFHELWTKGNFSPVAAAEKWLAEREPSVLEMP